MTPPRFSVVIPAYNAERTIEATIRSVYLQTTDDLEVAVVDDGSTDGTIERVLAVADERVTIHRQENAGPSAARNLGIARTSGMYVCPLDADDLLLPSFLETMAAVLDRDEGAGFAYTDAWALDASTGRVRRTSAKAYQRPPRPAPTDPKQFLRELLDRNFVYCCSLIRRTVLEEIGGYADALNASEDYELWLRIVAHGYRAAMVDGRLAVYREGQPSSHSSDPLRMTRAKIGVYDLVATTYPVDEATRARAVALGARWRHRERRLLNTPPAGPAYRALELLKMVRRKALGPFRWYRDPPAEVRQLLDAAGG